MFEKKIRKPVVLLSLLFFVIFNGAFVSCAVDDANITTATGTVVFDFEDAQKKADVHLMVFLQSESSVQRADYFTLKNEEKGWIWNISSPEIYESNGKEYVFCDNICAPEGKNIPEGHYSVVYYDAAGNSDEASFSIAYQKELLKEKSEKAPELLKSKTENVAIYDEQDELLYMGKKKNAWSTDNAILKEFKIGYKKRVCYTTANNSVLLMMPAELLKKDE